MKALLIFLLVNFVYLNAHCQTSERFNYEISRFNDMRYVISLKSEASISKNARSVPGGFVDEQNKKKFSETFHSIVEKSIPIEKRQRITGGVFVEIIFLLTGEVSRIRMYSLKENLEVLNEDVLYALFSNLQELKIDMSKYELLYPPTWGDKDIDDFIAWTFPLKQKE
ncbi:MAG: hypothetical protein FWG79_03020 [Bacteroidales bacterium]|nr:hypothetical protein [Bacteroidales bacterium]